MSLEFQHLVDPLCLLVQELTTDRLDLDCAYLPLQHFPCELRQGLPGLVPHQWM